MTAPNTISDENWRDIQERAAKASPPMFSKKAVARRKQDAEQQQNADKN